MRHMKHIVVKASLMFSHWDSFPLLEQHSLEVLQIWVLSNPAINSIKTGHCRSYYEAKKTSYTR